jgi:hypothetical protein
MNPWLDFAMWMCFFGLGLISGYCFGRAHSR